MEKIWAFSFIIYVLVTSKGLFVPEMYCLRYQSPARFHTVAGDKSGATWKRSHFPSHNFPVVFQSHLWGPAALKNKETTHSASAPLRMVAWQTRHRGGNPPKQGPRALQLLWLKRFTLFSLLRWSLLKAELPWTSPDVWRQRDEQQAGKAGRPPDFQFHCFGNGLPFRVLTQAEINDAWRKWN